MMPRPYAQVIQLVAALMGPALRGAAAFGFLVFAARTYGTSEFGAISFALAVASVLGVWIDYGFQLKTIRDIAQDESLTHTAVSDALSAKAVLAASAFAALAIAALLVPSFSELPSALFLGAHALQSSAIVLLSPYRATRRFGVEVLNSTIDTSALGAGVVAVWKFGLAPHWALSLYVSAKALGAAHILWRFTREYGVPRIRLARAAPELRYGLSFAIHAAVGALYLNADSLLLPIFLSAEEVGLYQGGLRLVVGAGVLLTPLNSVFTPKFVRQFPNDSRRVYSECVQWTVASVALGVLGYSVLSVTGERAAEALYGPSMSHAGSYFPVFWTIIALRIGSAVSGAALTAANLQAVRATAGVIALVAIIAGDIVLVPEFGAQAAAWVLLSAHILLCAIFILALRRRVRQSTEYGLYSS